MMALREASFIPRQWPLFSSLTKKTLYLPQLCAGDGNRKAVGHGQFLYGVR